MTPDLPAAGYPDPFTVEPGRYYDDPYIPGDDKRRRRIA